MSDFRAVLGVDPGGQETGLVLVVDGKLVAHEVVQRKGSSLQEWVVAVWDAVCDVMEAEPFGPFTVLVCVEDVNAPNPHLGLIQVRGLLDAAAVLGVVLANSKTVQLVPPGGHGSAPLRAYPPELVGPNEPRGTGVLRHCRSAWDIAHAGVRLRALAERTGER